MAEIVIKLVNGELAGKTVQSLKKEVRELQTAADKAKVGTEEWVKAHEKLDGAKKLQADLKKQIEGTTGASDMLKKAWNNLPGAQFFNQIVQSFGMMKTGVGGLISQFGLLKTAVAATGIGTLVIAFATLYEWFKKTDAGATLLSGIMKGLGIVFDTVFGKLIDFGKELGDFFTGKKSIKQGLIDLVEFIGNNLLNRLKSFVVIWQGIKDLDLKKVTDGFLQMGTGVENVTDKMIAFGNSVAAAVKEGIDLEAQLDAIEDKARELSVLNAESEKEVQRLLLQSKNVGLSYEERIALLDKASAIELRNHQELLANAQELERVRAEEVEKNLERNIENDTLEQQLADAQIARINLEKESITLQEKIANRRTALEEKRAAELQKAAEDELKVLQNLAALKAQAEEDGFDQELAQIQQQTQQKIEVLQGTEAQITEAKLLLKEIEEQQMIALGEKYQAIANASAQKAADEKKKIDDKAAADAIAAKQKEALEKQTIEQAWLDFASGSLGTAINMLSEDEKARKKNAAAIKGFTVAKILVDLQSEIAGYMKSGVSTETLGVAGTLKSILAIARAGLAVGKVNSQKFELGGAILGPRHSQGGVPIEAEGGEFIFSRKAVAAIGIPTLSRVNARYTQKMESGGPVNPFPNNSISSSGSFDTSSLENVLMANINAINARIDRIQVINDVTKTAKGIEVLNRLKSEADV
jgi:hypothetical protein